MASKLEKQHKLFEFLKDSLLSIVVGILWGFLLWYILTDSIK